MSLEETYGKVVGGLVASVIAGFTWLVRTILTNNKKIAVMETRIANDIERQKEMQERQKEILSQMKEIRDEVRQIHFKLHGS